MVELYDRRYLIADIVCKLELWARWLAYQPDGSVIGCAERPLLQQAESGFDWLVRGRHIVLGHVECAEPMARLEALTGEDRLNEYGFRYRPRLVRCLRVEITAGSSALTVEPDGEIREWFISPPELAQSGWQGRPGAFFTSRGMLPDRGAHDWQVPIYLADTP